MTRFLSLLFALYFLITPVFAHPGRTDSNGGHYNRSTGEYHYHHGHSAHQHYDMDGDGILDCPYTFKGTTSTTSSPDIYTTTITTAPATFSTWETTVWTSPSTSAPATAAKKGGNGPMIGWIVSAALVIALYGSSKSHEKESNLDFERIRKQNQEINALKKELEAKSQQLTDLDEETQRKLAELFENSKDRETQYRAEIDNLKEESARRLSELSEESKGKLTDLSRKASIKEIQLLAKNRQLQLEYDSVSQKLESILTAAEPEEGQSPQQHAVALVSKISALEDTVSEKNEKIQELCYELDKHVKREKVPSNVFFADDGLPVLLKSANKKYGDYTAYLSVKSGVYHLDPSCAPAHVYTVHLFNVPSTYRACSRCALGLSRTPPDWYQQLRK